MENEIFAVWERLKGLAKKLRENGMPDKATELCYETLDFVEYIQRVFPIASAIHNLSRLTSTVYEYKLNSLNGLLDIEQGYNKLENNIPVAK